jgi:hypothetical protein
MKRKPRWRASNAWTTLAIAFAVVGAVVLSSRELCGCAHPWAPLIGSLRPLELTDDAIRQRLQRKIPAGKSRAEVEQALREWLGRDYDRYCASEPPTGRIACKAFLEQDLFGTRKRGLLFRVLLDSSDKVASLDVSRFSVFEWQEAVPDGAR